MMRLLFFALIVATPAHAQKLQPATDRTSADIFLSGALTAARNAQTVYIWDIKLTYPKAEKRVGRDNWLLFSPAVEFTANKGTNANPDRISLGGAGELQFYTYRLFGRLLPNVAWGNVLAGEFDRDRTTKALSYQTVGRLLFGTIAPKSSLPVALVPRVEGGLEVGHNYRNKILEDGSGRVSRLYGGATAYQELGLKWLSLSLTYQVRRPMRDEVFYRKHLDGSQELRLTRDVRHYVEVSPIFAVGKWFSVKPTYKKGSLPPAFNYVDREVSFSLLFSAKAVSNR